MVLGTEDRIRFGESEVELARLVALFGNDTRIRLREGYLVRGRPLVFDRPVGPLPRPRVVLEHPRRNPETGDIEEHRRAGDDVFE